MQNNWIEKLSKALALEPYEQDWGISNSDFNRINEFISFYENNIPEHNWEPEALAELIFQSVEDAIENQQFTSQNQLKDFLIKHNNEFPETLNYWTSLTVKEWKMPGIINQTLHNKSLNQTGAKDAPPG
jgi:hypothetical protein